MTDLRAQLQSTLGDAYSIERELGGGGMSRVFVATEQSLGRPVVVKVLPGETAGAVSVERFKREIRLAASLQQANIVPVLTAGDAGGVAYYTMPFVKGESLRSRLAAKGPCSIAETIAVVRDVARALAFAHGEGVVHRDIKPENILLSGGTAVVTDFGIAKAIMASSTRPGDTTLTQVGVTLGTPAYMAPEQAVGEQVDHRADIYALGVVAYEMLTGASPFAGRSAQAMIAAHAMEAARPIAERVRDLPAALATLVMQCLEKEQSDRPQSAAAVLAALDAAMLPVAPVAQTPRTPMIAVLPFTNLGGSADDEYFSDGMTDDLIAQLSRIASVQVISRTSVMRYRKTEKASRDVAMELAASHVVEGTVRRSGNRLRIVAQLADVRSGTNLWAETFDRDVLDVFAIQSEVAQSVTKALQARLTSGERARIERRPTDDIEAYNQFLLGRRHWEQAGHPGAVEKAIDCFKRAVDRDPKFARAYGMLAQVYAWHGGGYFGMRPRDAADRMMSYAQKSLELDPDGVEPQFCLAYLSLWHRYDCRASEMYIERMLALSPNSVDAHVLKAFHLASIGRMDDAVDVAKRACELDPVSMNVRGHTVLFLHFAARTDEAVAALHAVENELGDDFFLSWVRTFVMVGAGRAREVLGNISAWQIRVPIALATINEGIVLAAAGEAGTARERLRDLEELRRHEYVWPTGLAWLCAALGERERAVDYVQQACDDRAGLVNNIAVEPAFDSLRDDPRFASIVHKIGAVAPTSGPAAKRLAGLRALNRTPISRSITTVPARPTIAVLPLTNISASADDEYFADGISEDIIAHLSRVASLKVISRTSVMRFKKTDKPMKWVAAELGASHVVEGSVRRAGQKLRIVAKLVDATADAQVWAQTFDRDITDVFAVQAEVAEQVTRALRATLAPAERARIARSPTKDQEAYDLFLLARHHLNITSEGGFSRAIDLYTQAVARDPAFARAWAALAFAHFFHLVGYYAHPRQVIPKAVAYANRALELDPEIAEAHIVLGLVEEVHNYNQEANGHHKFRAVELSPNSADAHLSLGNYYVVAGRPGDALTEADLALELDPASELTHLHANWLRYLARDLDRALSGLVAAESLFGTNLLPTVHAEVLVAMGRAPEATEIARRFCATSPSQINLGVMAWCLAAAGERKEALALIAELRARETREYIWLMPVAIAYSHLGEMDLAFEYLERSYENRVAWIHMAYAPSFDAFRHDARFQTMIRRVGAIDPASRA